MMDVTIRTDSGAPLITPWTAPGMSNAAYAAKSAADAKKQQIASDAQQALSSPKLSASEQAKSRARAEIQAIIKRLNILKKLFSANPKEMAKALAQVFKELKAALKTYKDAMKDEQGMGGDLVAGVLDAQTPAAGATQTADNPDAPSASGATTPQGKTDPQALYGQVNTAYQQALGNDGLDFLKTLKATVQEIEDKIVSAARVQMKAKKPDKATDDAFKDMDNSLKDLKKAMDDMDSDIKRDMPSAGQSLDVAA